VGAVLTAKRWWALRDFIATEVAPTGWENYVGAVLTAKRWWVLRQLIATEVAPTCLNTPIIMLNFILKE
ncbi:MAG: hypothetical protein OQK51_00385, partial [Kangiellaceae bacterium]|nr:hypothetical protein [Kangiellaceae bacterium]